MEFKDTIKIVYAWIGPMGPLWNTEVPNILSLANVAEGARTYSHNFWADDTYSRIFRFKKEGYVLYPAMDINREDIFIYPFSLTWRIPFTSYFYAKNGILEFSHTPNHIIWNVRNGKGFFLIEAGAEAWVHDAQLASIHEYFDSTHVPLNKVIYLTGCMNAAEIYENYCIRHGITDTNKRINIITYPSSIGVFSRQIKNKEITEPDYNTEVVPKKLFLCWNRRFRPHRSELILALDKHGLVDRSYYSMGAVDPEVSHHKFENSMHVDIVAHYDVNRDDINNTTAKLPLTIDGETAINNMCQDEHAVSRPYYQDSLVSIITETNYNIEPVTLTEKSFKPLREKHPFIIVGAPGALKAMRDLGFKTFSDFWNEDYDTMTDSIHRMQKIIEICRFIGSWDDQKILEFKRKVKEILDHNYNILTKEYTDTLSEKINDIVRKNII